jgi:hypothetical protein
MTPEVIVPVVIGTPPAATLGAKVWEVAPTVAASTSWSARTAGANSCAPVGIVPPVMPTAVTARLGG